MTYQNIINNEVNRYTTIEMNEMLPAYSVIYWYAMTISQCDFHTFSTVWMTESEIVCK